MSRSLALLGSAKIDIRNLLLRIKDVRDRKKLGKDDKNIQRLFDIFLQEKCRRGDPRNRVPVVVSQEDLDRILRLNHVERSNLRDSALPLLKKIPDDVTLVCLHGYHRMFAGQRYLDPADQWWGVNLYSKEHLSPALRKELAETDDNAKPTDDGSIFYHLRHRQIIGDKHESRRLKARLSDSKQRDYAQLQRQNKLSRLRDAFDRLLKIPGLWPALRIGIFHRLLTLRCTEVCSHQTRSCCAWLTSLGTH